MSEARFTKGPWLTRQGLDEDEIEVYPAAKAPHGLQKAEIATVKDYHDDYEANAHLIAAAPELYEAVEWLEVYAKVQIERFPMSQDSEGWNKVLSSLAKARGKTVL